MTDVEYALVTLLIVSVGFASTFGKAASLPLGLLTVLCAVIFIVFSIVQ